MSIAFGAVSSDGQTYHESQHPEELLDSWDTGEQARVAMVLQTPGEELLQHCAERFRWHPLAVEDAQHGHQRPKLERYGDTLFLVLDAVSYQDSSEKLTVGEVHVFVGPRSFVVIVRSPELASLAANQIRRAFRRPRLDPGNPQTLLYFVFDAIVDAYEPVLVELDEDLDEIEEQLFGHTNTSQRVYELFNEVVKFQRATRPLGYMLDRLMRGAEKYGMPENLLPHFRDVRDHTTRAVEHLDGLRAALQNALSISSTLAAEEQNDAMKKQSSWGALLVVPTIIAGIYGMNFEKMPELGWAFGYPAALGLILVVDIILWCWFRKRDWL